jgi:hypothetical protein
VPDAWGIADTLAARRINLTLGTSTYDPTGPMGKMLFNILATFAEFESDLIANSKSLAACTILVTTRLAIWLRCSPAPDQRSTAPSSAN